MHRRQEEEECWLKSWIFGALEGYRGLADELSITGRNNHRNLAAILVTRMNCAISSKQIEAMGHVLQFLIAIHELWVLLGRRPLLLI